MRAAVKYMDPLGPATWQTLLTERAGPCLSLFLPIQPTNVKAHDEPLRLRRLLTLAEAQLAEHGLGAAATEALVAPVRALAKDDLTFWQEQSEGLAIFRSPDFLHILRLPLAFAEKVVVSRRFWLRPLLPFLNGDGQYYLLTLSQNHVHLFQGERLALHEIALPAIPHSLAEATRFDEVQPVRQMHSIASAGAGQGRRAVAFHGHGTASDAKTVKDSLHHFLQAVDHGICTHLANTNAPLVVAGTHSICGAYRDVNRYAHLFPEILEGSPDRVSLDTLQARAWALLEPLFDQPRALALARYRQGVGSHDPHAVYDLSAVVFAAVNQRVDTLLVTPTSEAWGFFERDPNTVVIEQQPRPMNEELINLAVVHTLRNGGQVYVAGAYELGESRGVAALLRY